MAETPPIWLRAETKPGEARRALVPEDASMLVAQGFPVAVERSSASALPDGDYSAVGCTLVPEGSWRDAPADACILGLKELPEENLPLLHRHIYFAHAYKNQRGWRELLSRFREGGGELLDLEYLVNDTGRRIAAFGYWAGFTGAALAVMAWCGQRAGREPSLGALAHWRDKGALLSELRHLLEKSPRPSMDRPSVMIIGALGRVGSGARALADTLPLPVTPWDIQETTRGGPFREILEHDIFINCVLVNRPLPPFVTAPLIDGERRLRVIADVSCDPYGDHNPLPLYDACTSLELPVNRLRPAPSPLDLIAIDNLPSLLPRESSMDFSAQLLPSLLALGNPMDPVWGRARQLFNDTCARMEE